MTREEKTICKIYLDDMDKHHTCNEYKLLMQLLEQKPCDDCISREAAICLADELKDDSPDDDRLSDMVMSHNEGILEYQTQLSLLPSVTPAEKVGQWTRELIRNEHGGCIGAKMICSECGQDNGYDKRMKFCPNCGAKMEVEE